MDLCDVTNRMVDMAPKPVEGEMTVAQFLEEVKSLESGIQRIRLVMRVVLTLLVMWRRSSMAMHTRPISRWTTFPVGVRHGDVTSSRRCGADHRKHIKPHQNTEGSVASEM